MLAGMWYTCFRILRDGPPPKSPVAVDSAGTVSDISIFGDVEKIFVSWVVIFVLKKYWKPFNKTITMKIAHNKISIIDVFFIVVSSPTFEFPFPKADIIKYDIPITIRMIIINRGFMTASSFSSNHPNTPLTLLTIGIVLLTPPTVG